MTRGEFIDRLRAGLGGLPPSVIGDLIADYEAHFDDAAAAGRDEAQVAAALGDPYRLARELRAAAGMRRWREEKNPSAAANAIFAILGLGAIDLLILLPIVTWIAGVLLAGAIAAAALFGVGALLMVAGPFVVHGAPPLALVLGGLGVMAFGVCTGALSAMGTIGSVNALTWYGRLHLRVLRPALDAQGAFA